MKLKKYRVFIILGFCILLFLGFRYVYRSGYNTGYTMGYNKALPSESELKAHKDLIMIANKYNQVYNLCEQKYQLGLSGDILQAYTIKGNQEALLNDIDDILRNY